MRHFAPLCCGLLMLSVIGALSACPSRLPTGEGGPPVAVLAEPALVWPPPPDPPRIRYVGSLAGGADVRGERSFFGRVRDLVLGRQEQWMVRPTGVAVRGDLVAVADAGGQALFIIDRARRDFRRVTHGGDDELVSPVGVAIGPQDEIYLVDSYLRRIYVYDRGGRLQRSWGGGDIVRPAAIALDESRGRVYVSDAAGHRILAYTLGGDAVSVLGARGREAGQFNWPGYLCADREGMLYVVDALNFRVQRFSPSGEAQFAFGHLGDGSGDFARPKGIGVTRAGQICVVDALFDAVQVFDREGKLLLAFGQRGAGRGEFWLPTGLAIDQDDRIYVADSYNQRVQIFQFLGE